MANQVRQTARRGEARRGLGFEGKKLEVDVDDDVLEQFVKREADQAPVCLSKKPSAFPTTGTSSTSFRRHGLV